MLWRHVLWYNFTDVSKELNDALLTPCSFLADNILEPEDKFKKVSPKLRISTRLHDFIHPKTAILLYKNLKSSVTAKVF
jgi:hypothetical protein